MMRIRKNDTVIILTGKDKNKRGTILEVQSDRNKVLVKGIGMTIRHQKARRKGEISMIKEQEAPIEISNVMPVCPACHRPCRVNVAVGAENKMRACNRCKSNF